MEKNSFDEMRKVTACLTGHREINELLGAVDRRVTEAVEQAIQAGYRYFGAGGARRFDALASEVILKLKQKYPQIHLILVLPFNRRYAREKGWTQVEVDQHNRLKRLASKVVTLSAQYAPGYTVRYAERGKWSVVKLATA